MNAKAPATRDDWRALAAGLSPDVRPAIGGRRVDPRTDACFGVVDPFGAGCVARVPRCGAGDVDRAVGEAREAADCGDWSQRAATDRADVLRALAGLVEAHGPELALLDSLQMGLPVALAMDDIGLAARKLREAAAGAERLQGAVLPGSPSSLAMNLRAPQGVVGAITPWNFPLFVALGKIGPALAMGNTVVLKPSELAPLSCLRIADLAAEAGLPPGVLNVVPGLGPEAGHALASHRSVDMVSFTGSTETGRKLMRAAADSNLKALHLELGGKSPQVVLDDCGDLDALAQALADGFMFNGGQLCIAGTRLIVRRDLAAELAARVAEKTASWRFGDPLDPATTLGPLASAQQCGRVQRFIDRAESSGLRSHRGPAAGPGLPAPRVFVDVPPEAEIAQEEVFGPVACVMAFDHDTQAVQLANGTRYGLVATVWGSDAARGLAIARQVKAGAITVNTCTRPAPPRIVESSLEPAGESGFGAEGGVAGLWAFTRARHLLLNLAQRP